MIPPYRLDGPSQRTDGAATSTGAAGGVAGLDREARAGQVDVPEVLFRVVLCEMQPARLERVGLDHVGAGGDVVAVHGADEGLFRGR